MRRETISMLSGVFIGLFMLLGLTTQGLALSYGFQNISGNNAVNAAIGQAQLSVDVVDLSGNRLSFTFTNTGSAASSITDIYFDDGTSPLLSLPLSFVYGTGTGVSFSANANPPGPSEWENRGV